MSDPIKHECGIALIRLLKPLDYYREKYGSAFYGLKKLYLLMEKQHNRGQDGAGVATIKLDAEPGHSYISRQRSIERNPLSDIFGKINQRIDEVAPNAGQQETDFLRNHIPFAGELILGHLRYGTHGAVGIDRCHPFVRANNWKTRSLVMAGNFNLTNVDELFDLLLDIGQHPKQKADTVLVLEKIGHFLDEENQELFDRFKQQQTPNRDISHMIADNLRLEKVLQAASKNLDGGYNLAGMLGHGDAFVLRDPHGIRPSFYYANDEVVIATSERPAIQTAFNVPFEDIKELTPGSALIIKRNGQVSEQEIMPPAEKNACTFERIYFSRGNDADIYKERKSLGRLLADPVMKSINHDFENTVFSYIPNTANVAFYGMMDGLQQYLDHYKQQEITKHQGNIDPEWLKNLLALRPRREKIAIKDVKMRTFITQDSQRDDMVAHVYDVTYGAIKEGKDTLVVIDDSIVRGTTLKRSILRILDRLGPKKIIVVSSAPQIRYPDCYGIDMSRLGTLVAFQAVVALLKEHRKEHLIQEVYQKCKAQEHLPKEEVHNYVNELYDQFTYQQVTDKITELLTPEDIEAEVEIIYQTLEGLHEACPNHKGDWYFSGRFPTPGGNRVVNKAFINYVEGSNARAY